MDIPYRTKTKLIDLANLSAEDISNDDIAYSLAGQMRFNGNTRPLYSVAQHSILCCMVAPEYLKLEALLHDAHEYILGDIAGPVQKLITKNNYDCINVIDEIKDDLDEIITGNMEDTVLGWDIVREIDKRMMATEMLYFFGENYTDLEPYKDVLTEVWSPERSEMEFLYELERWTK